jgi:hypothetical protein
MRTILRTVTHTLFLLFTSCPTTHPVPSLLPSLIHVSCPLHAQSIASILSNCFTTACQCIPFCFLYIMHPVPPLLSTHACFIPTALAHSCPSNASCYLSLSPVHSCSLHPDPFPSPFFPVHPCSFQVPVFFLLSAKFRPPFHLLPTESFSIYHLLSVLFPTLYYHPFSFLSIHSFYYSCLPDFNASSLFSHVYPCPSQLEEDRNNCEGWSSQNVTKIIKISL